MPKFGVAGSFVDNLWERGQPWPQAGSLPALHQQKVRAPLNLREQRDNFAAYSLHLCLSVIIVPG